MLIFITYIDRTKYKYYSINEFSKILGVSVQKNWDKNGKLHPYHTSSNGYRYYSHEQLKELIEDEGEEDDKNNSSNVNSK